jgi:hypothetical protein
MKIKNKPFIIHCESSGGVANKIIEILGQISVLRSCESFQPFFYRFLKL